MGVKGLRSAIEHHFKRVASDAPTTPSDIHFLPYGATILIDGYGLLFYILEHKITLDAFRREYQGNYLILDKIVKTMLNEWMLNTNGMTFKIYFDGESHIMKSDCDAGRSEQLIGQWQSFNDAVSDYAIQHIKQNDMPIPPLSMELMKEAIKTFDKIDTIQCVAEADSILANDCSLHNSMHIDICREDELEMCYVIGNDSDFLVYSNIAYIEFSHFDFFNGIAEKVWRRSETAAAFDMTENQFREWCILIGNDYTSHFSRSLYCDLDIEMMEEERHNHRESATEVNRMGYESIMKLKSYLNELPDDFQLSSDDAMLQQAILYSRGLYDLIDASNYQPLTVVNAGSYEDTIMPLSRDQKADIDQYFYRQVIVSSPAALTYTNAFHTICSQIKSVYTTLAYDYIDSIYPKAFEIMTAKLMRMSETNYEIEDIHGYSKKIRQMDHRLCRADITIANYYQLIYIRYKRILGKDDLPVKYIFDGAMFHAMAYQLRVEAEAIAAALKSVAPTPMVATAVIRQPLPIDTKKDLLLRKINSTDRVILIQGETGCGKSSRLPVILYDHATANNKPCKMMISQPRKIDTSILMKWVRRDLGNRVGMRMGQGIRDETSETMMWFVTTGYLVKLLAHHPSIFKNHTHLIIDEVHERSVDSDVLCLFARRLLATNHSIKIILMSANMHAKLYKTYFTSIDTHYGDMKCINVGVRRHPVKILYLNDMAAAQEYSMVHALSNDLIKLTRKCRVFHGKPVPVSMAKMQCDIAVMLIRNVAVNGTGCLVFVSGIQDIAVLQSKFENLHRFKVYALHSDIPFKDQEAVFLPVDSDKVKVIIATNVAESSITIADVDIVICLGTHKSMNYSVDDHNSQLANSWISKASSMQRAGRTGRTRPGKVFRLYDKSLYGKFQEYATPEVLRTPLQDVILSLRVTLGNSHDFDGTVPILESLLEPPDVGNVSKSFEYLHATRMITSPDDGGELTAMGRFTGQMPMGFQECKLVVYGIALGVGVEAVILAAALIQPKTLFQYVSKVTQTDPTYFNSVTVKTFLGALALDDGIYSEPIMYLAAYIHWYSMKGSKYASKVTWLYKRGIDRLKFMQFVDCVTNLIERTRVALTDSMYDNASVIRGEDSLQVGHLTSEVVNKLRLLLTWSADGNIIRMQPMCRMHSSQIAISEPVISKSLIAPLFPVNVHWDLELSSTCTYSAKVTTGRILNDKREMLIDLLACASSDVVVPLLVFYSKSANSIIILSNNEQVCREIFSVFSTDWLTECDLKVLCPIDVLKERQLLHMEHHKIYVCHSTTKSIVEGMYNMSKQVSSSIVLTTPEVDGDSTLVCKGLIPSMQALAKLFFGDDSHYYFNNMNNNRAYRIDSAVIVSNQVLQFHDNSTGQSHTRSLIDDLPIGYRIIASLCQGHKNNTFQVKRVPPTALTREQQRHQQRQQQDGWLVAPINSKKGKKKNKKKALNPPIYSNDDFDVHSDDRIEVTIGAAVIPAWKLFKCKQDQDDGTTTDIDEAANAVLSQQSIHRVAYHLGKQALYGVTHTVLNTFSNGTHMSICRKVTFVPTGTHWISMAMQCIGIDPSRMHKDDKSGLSRHELRECRSICRMLNDMNKQSIMPNQELTAKVDELFSQYNMDQRYNHSPNPDRLSTDTSMSEAIHLCGVRRKKHSKLAALDVHKRSMHVTGIEEVGKTGNGDGIVHKLGEKERKERKQMKKEEKWMRKLMKKEEKERKEERKRMKKQMKREVQEVEVQEVEVLLKRMG